MKRAVIVALVALASWLSGYLAGKTAAFNWVLVNVKTEAEVLRDHNAAVDAMLLHVRVAHGH